MELIEPRLDFVCTVLWPKFIFHLPTQVPLQGLNQIPNIHQSVLQKVVQHFSIQLLLQMLQLSLLHLKPLRLHLHLLQLRILLLHLNYILLRLLNLLLQVPNLRLAPTRFFKLPHCCHFFFFEFQLLKLLGVVSD